MSAADWNGRWQGDVGGTPATLDLQASDGRITGAVDAGGYLYSIAADQEAASTARGRLVDDQTGTAVELRLDLAPGGVSLTVSSPAGGRVLEFRAAAARAAAPDPVAVDPAPVEGRDPALIAHWSRNETLVSGPARMVIEHHLEIRADGTYAKWTGQMVGGGDAWGIERHGGGAALRGRWSTRGDVVYVAEGAQWQPYARYATEGSSLLLTFGGGARELWNRR